jgi:hypothetical protein
VLTSDQRPVHRQGERRTGLFTRHSPTQQLLIEPALARIASPNQAIALIGVCCSLPFSCCHCASVMMNDALRRDCVRVLCLACLVWPKGEAVQQTDST